MKISALSASFWLCSAILSTSEAFAPKQPVSDSSVDAAMAQYEAALKLAMQSGPKNEVSYSDVALLQNNIDQQNEAMEKYEAALRAAFESSAPPPTTIEEIEADMENSPAKAMDNQTVEAPQQEKRWNSLTQEIQSEIIRAEKKNGEPLSEKAKDEIIATAIAGSILGTAVGSPLLIGAAFGYAGKNIQHLPHLSRKIVLAIQEKAHLIESDIQLKAHQIQTAPVHMVETLKSEEFKSLPKRSFKAVRDFLGSDEVKTASQSAVQAIKDGLQSDEMKALQNRASQVVKESFQSKA